MVDAEAVERRLRELDRRVAAARAVAGVGQEAFLHDENLRALAERHLQVAAQAAIDISVHILAEDSAEEPEDYGSAFRLLAKIGAIEPDLGSRLVAAAGLRNILVHSYLEVDPELLWESLQSLGDLERFAGAIRAYLTR